MMDRADQRALSAIGWRLLLLLLAYLFGAMLLGSLLYSTYLAIPACAARHRATGLTDEQLYETMLTVGTLLVAPLSLLLFRSYFRREGTRMRDLYAPVQAKFGAIAMCIPASFGLSMFAAILLFITEILFQTFGWTTLVDLHLNQASLAGNLVMYTYAILIGPVVEEILFRGVLIRTLQPHGSWFAVVASAMCFALFHGNLNQFPNALLLGLFYGYLSVQTQSLIPGTVAHIVNNAVSAGLSAFVLPETALIAIELTIAGVGLVFLFRVLRKWGRMKDIETPNFIWKRFFCSIPILCYLVITVILLAINVRRA